MRVHVCSWKPLWLVKQLGAMNYLCKLNTSLVHLNSKPCLESFFLSFFLLPGSMKEKVFSTRNAKLNKNIWDVTKRLSAHLYSLWSFPLSYIILTVNLRVNMGTNVQKNFFSSARTFNRWIFKHVLFTGKCKEKKSGEGKFFSSFVRQRIVLFWVLVRMKYDKAVTYLLNIVDCQGLSCGERTSNISVSDQRTKDWKVSWLSFKQAAWVWG